MKPIAWYDPSNGVVSTDQDCPLFTPLGQVWPLCLKHEWVGLTDEEVIEIAFESADRESAVIQTIDKLKEKNT